MAYQKQVWENLPSQNTPLSADRLNHMEDGIVEAWEHGGGGGGGIDIGTIVPFSGDISAIPNGFMLCDGSAISRTTYATLFSIIGTTYGAGDGSTTFNIPNLKGKTLVGLDSEDNDFDTLGETGGEKTHTLTVDEMPSHDHNVNFDQSTGGGTSWLKSGGNSGGPYIGYGFVNSTGGGQAHNNLQPYITVNYIIKVLYSQSGNVYSESLPVGSEIEFDGDSQDIPTGWEQISDYAKLLWTNPNPTSDFADQDITLSSSDYDVLEFYYRSDTFGNRGQSVRVLKGYGIEFDMFSTSVATRTWRRRGIYVSDTKYHFESCIQLEQGASTATHNEYCVPLYVVGYKTGLFN